MGIRGEEGEGWEGGQGGEGRGPKVQQPAPRTADESEGMRRGMRRGVVRGVGREWEGGWAGTCGAHIKSKKSVSSALVGATGTARRRSMALICASVAEFVRERPPCKTRTSELTRVARGRRLKTS